MTFASYSFLLAFLPAALALHYTAARCWGPRAAVGALCAASFAFCAWGSPTSAALLALSALANFALGRALAQRAPSDPVGSALFAGGIAANLAVLGWFKYAGFFAENWNAWLGGDLPVLRVALPLGISFFTFQQLGYLSDARRGLTRGDRFLDYALFVSFFPKLISGPITDSRALLPQFSSPGFGRYSDENLVLGLALLAAGLFKKVMIADELGETSDALFSAVARGAQLSSPQAWIATYTAALQTYFDFSGYSDMALGVARCLGIVLPLNFYSPYQATSLTEYWRRWHMTLTQFLMRYVYTPLATPLTRWSIGRGHGPLVLFASTVALPTFVTFALAGLWHGAGWTFVIFGLLHALFITANQGWRELRRRLVRRGRWPRNTFVRPRALASWALTLAAVLVAFVFWRAPSLDAALALLGSMAGAHGWRALPLDAYRAELGLRELELMAAAAALTLLAPNVEQLLRRFEPAQGMLKDEPSLPWRWQWRPHPALALVTALLLLTSLAALGRGSTFIYSQF